MKRNPKTYLHVLQPLLTLGTSLAPFLTLFGLTWSSLLVLLLSILDLTCPSAAVYHAGTQGIAGRHTSVSYSADGEL